MLAERSDPAETFATSKIVHRVDAETFRELTAMIWGPPSVEGPLRIAASLDGLRIEPVAESDTDAADAEEAPRAELRERTPGT